MSISSFPKHTRQDWSPSEMLEQDTEKRAGLIDLWYRLTTSPEPSTHLSFVRRESARRGRLLSTIVFFLMLTISILIPATLFIPNHYVILLCLIMLAICLISLLFNRRGKTLVSSVIVVATFEIAFILVITSTIPFDVPNLPLYDLLTMTVLLAASLLPRQSVFIVALANSVFIGGDLLLQPHTLLLTQYLHTQFYSALIRPISLQILAGLVVYLWVRSTSQAIARADRAEMLAHLEHALAEQKEQLEIGIQQILNTHAEVSNGRLDIRSPLAKDNVLWPLANALNTLLARFQRSYNAEQELQRIWLFLPHVVNTLQEAEKNQQPIPQFQRTMTPLDPLLSWLSGRTFSSQSSPDQPFPPQHNQPFPPQQNTLRPYTNHFRSNRRTQ
jgi:hypothetical protein